MCRQTWNRPNSKFSSRTKRSLIWWCLDRNWSRLNYRSRFTIVLVDVRRNSCRLRRGPTTSARTTRSRLRNWVTVPTPACGMRGVLQYLFRSVIHVRHGDDLRLRIHRWNGHWDRSLFAVYVLVILILHRLLNLLWLSSRGRLWPWVHVHDADGASPQRRAVSADNEPDHHNRKSCHRCAMSIHWIAPPPGIGGRISCAWLPMPRAWQTPWASDQ